jgi:hypothetical protein
MYFSATFVSRRKGTQKNILVQGSWNDVSIIAENLNKESASCFSDCSIFHCRKLKNIYIFYIKSFPISIFLRFSVPDHVASDCVIVYKAICIHCCFVTWCGTTAVNNVARTATLWDGVWIHNWIYWITVYNLQFTTVHFTVFPRSSLFSAGPRTSCRPNYQQWTRHSVFNSYGILCHQ